MRGVPCPWGLLESPFHLKTDMTWQWERDGLQPNSRNLWTSMQMLPPEAGKSTMNEDVFLFEKVGIPMSFVCFQGCNMAMEHFLLK